MDPSRVNSIPGTPDNTKRRVRSLFTTEIAQDGLLTRKQTSLGFGALLRRFTSKGKASEIED